MALPNKYLLFKEGPRPFSTQELMVELDSWAILNLLDILVKDESLAKNVE